MSRRIRGALDGSEATGRILPRAETIAQRFTPALVRLRAISELDYDQQIDELRTLVRKGTSSHSARGRGVATSPTGDSYSALERKFIGPFRQRFFAATWPAVALLARLDVHPNAVSALQVVGGFAVVALVPAHPRLAFSLFLGLLVTDGIDGALARATGRASALGALVDQCCDHIREITVVGGMAYWRALAIGPAIAYGPIYTGLNLTLYLANVQGAPVPWAVKSYLVVYPALFLYLWFGLNVLTPAVLLSEALMLVAIGMGLRNLARAM